MPATFIAVDRELFKLLTAEPPHGSSTGQPLLQQLRTISESRCPRIDTLRRDVPLDETLPDLEWKGVRRAEFEAVCNAADGLRQRVNGDVVSYVVNRNINYTNICYFHCEFCAFSKGRGSEELRGKPYDISADELARRALEAWERGATEVCMQGGIHPDYTGQTYLDILATVRRAAPAMHIHAFSPLEVWQGAHTLGLSLDEFVQLPPGEQKQHRQRVY